MVGGSPSGGGGWAKWALAGAVLVIIALFLAMLSMRGQKTQKPQPTTVVTETQKPKKPKRWNQDYSATFRYGQNTVTVTNVKVEGLRKSLATIRYRITVRNVTGKIGWIKNPDTWQMRSIDLRAYPKRSFDTSASPAVVNLTFRWPRKNLVRVGAALQMLIPGEDKLEKVELGLEIPSDFTGVKERSGIGSLTRR